MDDAIKSPKFDVVREALEKGDIGLQHVKDRFVDFKTAYCKDAATVELNERYDEKNCWDGLYETEKQKVRNICALPHQENPLERWLAYRLKSEKKVGYYLNTEQKRRLGFKANKKACWYWIDCDGSKSSPIVPTATNLLYRTLWTWRNNTPNSADTMNSMWTTYKQALELFDKKAWTSRKAEEIMKEMVKPYSENTPLSLREEYVFHTDESADDLEKKVGEQLEILAHLTHALGNFIPCASPFNGGRYNATNDYWDITLMYIRDWYLNRQLFLLKSDLPSNGFNAGILGECRDWLNSFGVGKEGWNSFVNDNFLKAYTDGTDEGGYKIKPFYNDYTIGKSLPESREDLLECLLSMNAAIIARGNEMGKKLEENLTESDWRLFFKDPYPESSSSPR